MALAFALVWDVDGMRSFVAQAGTAGTVRIDVFQDYAQAQLGRGYIVKLPDEAAARAFAERLWGA